MKIVIASDNFYPELSGITDSLVLSIKTLTARGHQVLVLAPRYARGDYEKVNLKEEELTLPNLTVCRLPSVIFPGSATGQSRIALPLGRGYQAIKKFAPDIIHTHSPFGAGLEALVAAKKLKIPLIGTNHTPIAEFMAYSPLNFNWLTGAMCRYFSWYYNQCYFVSAPSQALLDEMAKSGFKQKSAPISNPINVSGFKPAASPSDKQALKKLFKLSEKTVLYTGRLAAEKHVDVIIKAMVKVKAAVPEITLALTGHGAAETSLKDLTKQLDLETIVRFFGFVSPSDLKALYQASDIFTIMSTAESQSLSLFQAFASGLPVIGARARALPEYINHDNGYLVEPGDDQALAEIIIKLATDPVLATRLGENGLHASERFSPVEITNQWEKLYNETAQNYGH